MPETSEIRRYLLRHVAEHPSEIAKLAAKHFGLSRQAINRHLRNLTSEGLLRAHGATRARSYDLVVDDHEVIIDLDSMPEEDKVWREHVLQYTGDLPKPAREICHYGFTEMVNNVIDHSEGSTLGIRVATSAASIDLDVWDNGIGIFRKIRDTFHLEDDKHAVLELSKGKLTTDPVRHTGEGIFFTSRMFDTFTILSGSLFLCHMQDDESDWLLEHTIPAKGTSVNLGLDPLTTRTTQEVFDRFTDLENGSYGFDVTHVPVVLAQYGDENLVSRSQARRVLARVDLFRKVVFNFNGVEAIGQSFADEIFRVFQREHPGLDLFYANANERVEKMIRRAQQSSTDEQIKLL